MSNFLKQSTAVVISFGPALDKTDGVTEETGLVSAIDHATTGIKLSKNGGALTIRHASVTASTYDAYGMYRVTLDTTDTNTLGTLRMAFNEAATCLPVWQDFMVLPANIFDSLVSGSDLIDVSMVQILGTAVVTPATAGILDVNVKNIDNDAASASGTVTFPNATLASTTNITAGTITTATNLTNLPAAAALEATLTAMKGATFAGATDSLEAIRDRGDAAWATATGFATPTNITAGTITTVTNLTNAPTAGDLTATMKASVTTAATAATPIAASVAGNVGGNVVGSVGSVTAGVTLAASAVQAIWDALTSALTTVGSIGKRIVDNLDAAITSRLATAGYTAPLDAAGVRAAVGLASANLDTQLDAIPTAPENADANWDEARSGHVAAGSFGEGVKINSIADAAITFDAFDYQALQEDVFHGTALSAIGQRAAQLVWQSLSADYAPAGGFHVADSMGEQMTHLDADVSSAGGSLDAAGVRAAVGLASANLDTQLGTLSADLATIDNYVDTEIAGLVITAAAIQTKTDYLPSATAGAAGGVFIAGANAATSITTALTANITGNLSGSVGSVTGAVGSVTGAVGSVTGAVGSVTGNVGGNLVGSVGGNVTGNLGGSVLGNVDGSVGSVTGAVGSVTGAVGSVTAEVTANMTKILGTAVSTPATAGILDVNILNIGGSAADLGATPGMLDVRIAEISVGGQIQFQSTQIAAVAGSVGSVTGAVGSVTGNVGGNVTGSVGSVVGAVGSVTGLTAANLDVAVSTRLATAGYTAPLDAAGTRSAVGLASANLDTQLTTIDDLLDTEVAAIKAQTDLIPASPASTTNITAAAGISLSAGERTTLTNAILDLADGATSGYTLREALEVMLSVLAGKLSGAATATITIRDINDTKDVLSVTTDSSGNRTALTITP